MSKKFIFNHKTFQLFVGKNCPCEIIKNQDNICPCKKFREEGICKCKLFTPLENNVNIK